MTELTRVSFRHRAPEGAFFLPTIVDALLGEPMGVEVLIGGSDQAVELLFGTVIGVEIIDEYQAIWLTVERVDG